MFYCKASAMTRALTVLNVNRRHSFATYKDFKETFFNKLSIEFPHTFYCLVIVAHCVVYVQS